MDDINDISIENIIIETNSSNLYDSPNSELNSGIIQIDQSCNTDVLLYKEEEKQKMITIEQSLHTDPFHFHFIYNSIRNYLIQNNFIESYVQNRLSNLNSCKNIFNACLFDMYKFCYCLPQSNEIWLEYEMIKYNKQSGFFCQSSLYFNHNNGLDNYIEPAMEFSLIGGLFELEKLFRGLLKHMGYTNNIFNYKSIDYKDILLLFQLEVLTEKIKIPKLSEDKTIYFVKNIPKNDDTTWNDYDQNGIYNKIIVIIYGKVVFYGIQKSNEIEKMRNIYLERNDYPALCEFFGEERVLGELESYLELPFMDRCTGKIKISSLIELMNKENGY